MTAMKWFGIAVLLYVLVALAGAFAEQTRPDSVCSGPTSGQNSDVCAEMQDRWQP